MADIRIQVPDDFITPLREKLKLTNAEVVEEALTMLGWAVEERERGRLVLSADTKGKNVERLAMRSLSMVQAKGQVA
jgi:hypothetical protein